MKHRHNHLHKRFKYKIELLNKGSGWYYRMISVNGRILNHSERYSSKAACMKIASQLEHDLRGAILYVNPTKSNKKTKHDS